MAEQKRFILAQESTLENLNEVKILRAGSAITLAARVDQGGEVEVVSGGPHSTPINVGRASKVSQLVPLVQQNLLSLLQGKAKHLNIQMTFSLHWQPSST